MKIIKIAGLLLLGLVVIILVLRLAAPRSYHVERSVVVHLPANHIFEHIRYWCNWQAWSPWAEIDSTMRVTIAGIDGEVGAKYLWDGRQAGRGEMVATTIEKDKELSYHLRFIKPWESESDGYLRLATLGDSTRVTWAFYGKSSFPWNVITLFFSMDSMIGKDFERGLERLKTILESQSSAHPE